MQIETLQNDDGYVIAYCVWTPRDEMGFEDYNGEYVFVDEMWIHKSVRGMKPIRYFIQEICEKYPRAKWGYWKRRKYGERIKMFSKEQIYKQGD